MNSATGFSESQVVMMKEKPTTLRAISWSKIAPMILNYPLHVIVLNFLVYLIIFSTFLYFLVTPKLKHPSRVCVEDARINFNPVTNSSTTEKLYSFTQNPTVLAAEETKLHHIVFGIASSAKLWNRRKRYTALWWRPNETRGFVWLDKSPVEPTTNNGSLPQVQVSSDTSRFKYRNRHSDRSAIRISRIVSETVRLGLENVRWIVLGDDDTFFVTDNLVRVLSKYDHNQFYYIGSSSESHLQNIRFSYNMAYGGGGFAISYPLAKSLEKMQDKCLKRYSKLYGSDDRIQACMAELGVPLTKEVGFHQFDIYGNALGLLAAHPVAPLVSLHHLDVIEPIFPNTDRAEALERLKIPMKLDSAGLMQQSICYDWSRNWTVSVSWGYVAQIYRGIIPAREMERPERTFMNWYRKNDDAAFSFNTRPPARNACDSSLLYILPSSVVINPSTNVTTSEYVQLPSSGSNCSLKNKVDYPGHIQRIQVQKRPNGHHWDKAPRRNCCRVLPSRIKGTISIDIGECT